MDPYKALEEYRNRERNGTLEDDPEFELLFQQICERNKLNENNFLEKVQRATTTMGSAPYDDHQTEIAALEASRKTTDLCDTLRREKGEPTLQEKLEKCAEDVPEKSCPPPQKK